MPFKASHLWAAPEVNPINHKARSIPVFNPLDKYGRTFFYSWSGFLVAFLSWYAFPPLLTLTIRKDLHMSQNEYANSNIMGLCGTLVIRLISGPLCDKFGPRYVFVGCLLAGAIITTIAMGILFTADDTPTGSWATRNQIIEAARATSPSASTPNLSLDEKADPSKAEKVDREAGAPLSQVDTAAGEVIVAPTLKEGLSVFFSLQTLALAAPYACSFGGELAINSIIGSYYLKNFPKLGQTGSGRWAAMLSSQRCLPSPRWCYL